MKVYGPRASFGDDLADLQSPQPTIHDALQRRLARAETSCWIPADEQEATAGFARLARDRDEIAIAVAATGRQ